LFDSKFLKNFAKSNYITGISQNHINTIKMDNRPSEDRQKRTPRPRIKRSSVTTDRVSNFNNFSRSDNPRPRRNNNGGSNGNNRNFNKDRHSYNHESNNFNREDRDFNREDRNFNREERNFNREDRNHNKEGRGFNKRNSNNRPSKGQGGFNNKFNNKKKTFNKNQNANDNGDNKAPNSPVLHPHPANTFNNGDVRLNRFLAASGICSRREADTYIKTGCVQINGQIVTEMGIKISSADVVKFNGETIRSEQKIYILLNKPKDYITTNDDPHNRKTVFELIKNACRERVFAVGRLDRNTTGLLLFTNDGDLAAKLIHPRFDKKKIYHVLLNKKLLPSDMANMKEGFILDDGPVKIDELQYTSDDRRELGIEIHSGKNRIVRRIFEHFGYEVEKLDRVYFCGLTKKNLPRGKWRYLDDNEVSMLQRGAFE